jgi:hypothetical protein
VKKADLGDWEISVVKVDYIFTNNQ